MAQTKITDLKVRPRYRAAGSPKGGEKNPNKEDLRNLMFAMNPDAGQIEEAVAAAPQVTELLGRFGTGLRNQITGLAELPGLAADLGQGALQKIRELSPPELRGKAPPMDTQTINAFIGAANRAKDDPKGTAAKALAAVGNYIKEGTSSPGNFAQMLGENVPLPVPRTPPVLRMAEETGADTPRMQQMVAQQFAGRLDDFVSKLKGPVRKDQFLGQLSNKFRSYEVDRAKQALADLPDNARLTSQELAGKLAATLSPTDLTTKIIPPREGGFYQSYDNPYPERPLGIIHLNKQANISPEEMTRLEGLDQLKKYSIAAGPDLLAFKDGVFDKQDILRAVRDSGAYTPTTASTVKKLSDQLDKMASLSLGDDYDGYIEAFRGTRFALNDLLKVAQEQGPPLYEGQHPTLGGGINPVAFSRFSEHTADIPGLGTGVRGIYVNELQSDLLQDVRRSGAKGRTAEMDQIELDRLTREQSSLRGRINQGIRGENFTDPEDLENLKNELGRNIKRQGILGQRLKRATSSFAARFGQYRNMYELPEPFAGMETSPAVLQQLLIKNVIGAAARRGDSFVAFPGVQSKQPQLYKNLPNNLKQVLKDLGPGFDVRMITLPSAKGELFTHPAVVWGPEAATRVTQKGIPFAQGGEVKTLAKSY